MNRDQKAAVIDEVAGQISGAEAVFAVDYRGLSVPQAAELRTRLRDADASFRVVKNTLTERAAAKALATFSRENQLLAFKGGLLDGAALDAEQIQAISRLPTRDVLYGQLVGMVAAPITGLARGLNALLSGVAVALGQILEKKEKGELPAGAATAESPGESEAGGTQAETPDQDAEAPAQQPAAPDAPAEGAPDTPDQTNEEADASA